VKSIFQQLKELGLTSEDTRELYSTRTRDVDDLKVWRDTVSEVIYIDNFYIGDNTYKEGSYRPSQDDLDLVSRDYDTAEDANRRLSQHRQFVVGKDVLDFGCGAGEFLKRAKPWAKSLLGVELQENYFAHLSDCGMEMSVTLKTIPDNSIDSAFAFHVIEHLPDPLSVINDLYHVTRSGGVIVVEVPHARDFLLSQLSSESFKQFTLWSQHLVLHTRDSLKRLLAHESQEAFSCSGVQRFSISNHLVWLMQGKPGGHKGRYSVLESEDLRSAYSQSLERIDATDTLVAVVAVR